MSEHDSEGAPAPPNAAPSISNGSESYNEQSDRSDSNPDPDDQRDATESEEPPLPADPPDVADAAPAQPPPPEASIPVNRGRSAAELSSDDPNTDTDGGEEEQDAPGESGADSGIGHLGFRYDLIVRPGDFVATKEEPALGQNVRAKAAEILAELDGSRAPKSAACLLL
jgi:hypothetical protein